MTPMLHLLLLPSLLSIAAGMDLEEKKGLFVDTQLDVPEATPVPYAVHQFQVPAGATTFKISGEGLNYFKITNEGWLYLENPLKWSEDGDHYVFNVVALADEEVVGDPITVTINVLDINNNPPQFDQNIYTAAIRERTKQGVPFIRVSATDQDDSQTPNAKLHYSLEAQIPNNQNILLFQIDPNNGEISTTKEGEEMLKAKPGIQYARGEDRSIDSLKAKFNEYCSEQNIPYEQNPFFTCVERQEIRRRNADPLEDQDYTLFIRVQDMGGTAETALSGNAIVQIVVEPNLWVNPGPITVKENLKGDYPRVIAKVQSNDPDAIYSLVQKERELIFPFQITADGEILVTGELDREEKEMYILVVFAKDNEDREVDPPMEIPVVVADENDNEPVCENLETEIQENEPPGSSVGQLVAFDADKEGTLNSKLIYTIISENLSEQPNSFSIDQTTGEIKALRHLLRKDEKVYNLDVRVSDAAFSTNCKVVVKVIDVNNELPMFKQSYYGNHTLAEDAAVGSTVLTIEATDADDPDTGSSYIMFNISEGNEGEVFTVETDGKGVGYVVITKALDFESHPTYNLQIDARNTEPLTKSLSYGTESTATLSVSVTDVDEPPEFTLEVLDVTVPENFTKGSVLLAVDAKDPEGKEIGFKLDGDAEGWLEIDVATGEIKTKNKMDRETLETFDVTITAFEKENPDKSSERTVHVRLLDINDNHPKLVKKDHFICMQKVQPITITAEDGDADPFSRPFTFSFGKKPQNWKLIQIDDSSAELQLMKKPTEERIHSLNIVVKDNAGMGVGQKFDVRVCNCTSLGYCYIAPHGQGFKLPMGYTIGILAGILGFCVIVFIIVIKRSDKKGKKKGQTEDSEQNPMM